MAPLIGMQSRTVAAPIRIATVLRRAATNAQGQAIDSWRGAPIADPFCEHAGAWVPAA